MRCEAAQEKISAFIDCEFTDEEIEKAFEHVFGCKRCQEFVKYSVRVKSVASSETFEISETPEFKKKRFSIFKTEIPVPGFLLGAMTVMLFLLSFLLGVFVYDKATSGGKTPAYIIRPKKVIVYGMPKITVYPDNQPKTRGVKSDVKIN